jgi:tRNA (cmo5U34)-methyltransferase
MHHLSHERKCSFYRETYEILNPKGIFCNLGNIATPSWKHRIRILYAIGFAPETESKSDNVLPMKIQLEWLKEIGFKDVDCYRNWLEFALLKSYKL